MLIIYAHPNKSGHCGFILEQTIKALDKSGQTYRLLDLYEMNYDPVLKPEEHYTSGQKKVTPDNAAIQQLIKNETRFIFIYPTWWNSPPAILKGFIDRVMVAGFAFRYVGRFPQRIISRQGGCFCINRRAWIIKPFLFRQPGVKIYDPGRACFLRHKSQRIYDRPGDANG